MTCAVGQTAQDLEAQIEPLAKERDNIERKGERRSKLALYSIFTGMVLQVFQAGAAA